MKYDDGQGPYDFCKHGLSHCEDQLCDCVDTSKYRALYIMAREREGWTLGPKIKHVALKITAWTLSGMFVGALILWMIFS